MLDREILHIDMEKTTVSGEANILKVVRLKEIISKDREEIAKET